MKTEQLTLVYGDLTRAEAQSLRDVAKAQSGVRARHIPTPRRLDSLRVILTIEALTWGDCVRIKRALLAAIEGIGGRVPLMLER